MADEWQQEEGADTFVAFWNDLLAHGGSRHERLSGTRRRGGQPWRAAGHRLPWRQRQANGRSNGMQRGMVGLAAWARTWSAAARAPGIIKATGA